MLLRSVQRSDDKGQRRRPGPGDRDRFARHLSTATPFSALVSNARLSFDEAEVLALLAAAEIEPTAHLTVAALQGDAAKNRLTIGTLMAIFADDPEHRSVRAVGAESALRRAALVDVVADGPWSDHVVALHPTVAWALVGDQAVDPDLPRPAVVVRSVSADGHPVTVVSGRDRILRRRAATEHTVGDRFLAVDAPGTTAGWQAIVREASLTGASLIVELGPDGLDAVGRRWVETADHLGWALSSRVEVPLDRLPDRPWTAVLADDRPPTDQEWADAFGNGVDRSHRLSPEQIDRVTRAYEAHAGDLDAAVRRLATGRLDTLATRIRPSRSWDDLVLTPGRKAALRSIADRYLNTERVRDEWGYRATTTAGIVALFSGPSGTGKTMATEVIAGELGLDVFKLDLSSVVSKYIGETEKNLEAVFDAASAGNLVLFFDEADALFGKRSEVKDARDRYANIEVSYLLQRIEAYEGLVIMATNFEKNVDEAFLRRIHIRIEFALPGPDERATIWRQNLPAAAPVSEFDVEWLARQFEISGGVIRNASAHAAYTAAARGEAIGTEHAVLGVATELRKLGRLLKRDGFGQYYDRLADLDTP